MEKVSGFLSYLKYEARSKPQTKVSSGETESVERLSPKVPLTESAHVRARGGKREFNATNVAKTQGETTRAHHLTFLVIRKLEECCQQ